MAEHLASYGYIVVSVWHHRLDAGYLSAHGYAALLVAAGEPETRRLRLGDMSFVLDELVAGEHGIDLLAGRIDTARVGALGHSFGAFATLSLIV